MNDSVPMTKMINLDEAVSLLGVSSATVRNWVRHNYLIPKNGNDARLLFDYAQVTNLKERIASGEIDRLGKRANKKQSVVRFIPEEYADGRDTVALVQKIVDAHTINTLDTKSVLLGLILNFLKGKGFVHYVKPHSFDQIVVLNAAIQDELEWWFTTAGNFFGSVCVKLLDLILPATGDILGLVYQSLSVEGGKVQAGSYYTPRQIVEGIVEDHIRADSLVLDPCCGTGQFLLAAANKINDPTKIWGFDIDELAVKVTRIKILSHFPNHTFAPNIFCKNTLLDVESGDLFCQDNIPTFDAIITNPPWGVHFSSGDTERLQRLYCSVRSNEAFSYFLFKGMQLLKEGGVLSFILPESLLNIKTHKDIRWIVLERSKIKKVKHLGRIFKNVFTPVIRLDVVKSAPEFTDEFEVERNGVTHSVKQFRLRENPDYIFDVFNDDKDILIFQKVFSREYTTLKDNADWALGVVTGDNQKYLSSFATATNEPILTGKDLKRFLPMAAKTFIEFEPDKFQQVAPEHKFRVKEKLIYKFISRELVFSYDDKQTLTLNSANILIPRIPNYPIKSVLGLFNSFLYQFIFQKKFGALKVLRGDIEKLPLPLLSQAAHVTIENFVNRLLDRKISPTERNRVYLELDQHTMEIFGLSGEERDHVRRAADVSSTLSL